VPNVKIYHYVALPKSAEPDESIDLRMYEISETKDLRIQKMIRLVKEAAFDCSLFKDRNTVTNNNLDGTRNCEYTMCNFTCDKGAAGPSLDSDDRNYRLIYFKFSKEYVDLKNFLIKEVTKHPITVDGVERNTSHSRFEIMTVLQDLLDSRPVLFARPEGCYYLRAAGNVFYAATNTDNIISRTEDPGLLNYYSRNTAVFMGKSIDELVRVHQEDFMVSLVRKLFKSNNLATLQRYVAQLPPYLQDRLLCYSVSAGDSSNNFVRDMVLNNFRLYYKKSTSSKKAYVWLSDNVKCTDDYTNPLLWRLCTSREKAEINSSKRKDVTIKTVNNPYGYVGLLNRTTNDFCLRKIDGGDDAQPEDKRKKNVGKRCINWKKTDLVDLVANRLRVRPDDEDFSFDESDVSKMKENPKFKNILSSAGILKDYKRVAFWNGQDVNHLCNTIMNKLMDQKMVIEDPNCGTTKKIR
jgi:hypothetical protein